MEWFEPFLLETKKGSVEPFFVYRKHAHLALCRLAFIDDVRTWVMENREEARILSNSIRELAKQAALKEKKVA